jgi:hypothetical protein
MAVPFKLSLWGDFLFVLEHKKESGDHKKNKFPLTVVFLLMEFLSPCCYA